MKLSPILLLFVLFFCACEKKTSDNETNAPSTDSLHRLLAQYHETKLKFDPLQATYSGDNRYNDTLPNNISQAYREQIAAFYRTYKEKLQAFRKEELSEEDQISYDVFMWECNINLEGMEYPAHLIPIQYSLENEAESEESIVSEIERYMAMPGQALSYKVGQLKILELRALARQEFGDKFDIKVFHNKVLESGNLPLEVLEHKISRWIEEEKL